jgi:hypothetical protein
MIPSTTSPHPNTQPCPSSLSGYLVTAQRDPNQRPQLYPTGMGKSLPLSFLQCTFTPALLKVWSSDQKFECHHETCEKCKFPPGSRSVKSEFLGVSDRNLLNRPPGDSAAHCFFLTIPILGHIDKTKKAISKQLKF